MADTEFELLTSYHQIPEHIKSGSQTYMLVHIHEDSPSPTDGEESRRKCDEFRRKEERPSTSKVSRKDSFRSNPVEDSTTQNVDCDMNGWREGQRFEDEGLGSLTGERKRRKLPEIPANKKPMFVKQLSLADELSTALERTTIQSPAFTIGGQVRAFAPFRCHNFLRDGDSSPDSDRFHSTDADSGNSTAHSPDVTKSVSPQPNNSISPASPTSTCRMPFTDVELLDPTHRGLQKFITRHHDEIDIEIGDPIYVCKEADDLWCEGINLRTGRQGIFPSAYVVDMEYSDFDPTTPKVKRERFILGYMGSVETLCHKGNSVLCQAIKKIKSKDYTPHSCILEVSDTGLRMVDRKKPQRKEIPCHDYFYSLKNVSFCAFHPRDQRYLGFITKHPHCDRFACHVFFGNESTRPVAEAVGRAFQRFYHKFIETAYPLEDIYIEYTGHCPTLKFHYGKCFGADTREIMLKMRNRSLAFDAKPCKHGDPEVTALKENPRYDEKECEPNVPLDLPKRPFVLGYTGFIPGYNFRYGSSFAAAANESLSEFTRRMFKEREMRERDRFECSNASRKVACVRHADEITKLLHNYNNRICRKPASSISAELPPIAGYTGHIPRLIGSEASLSQRYHTAAKAGLALLKKEKDRQRHIEMAKEAVKNSISCSHHSI